MPTNEKAGVPLANALLTVLKESTVGERKIGILTVVEASRKFKVSRWTLRRWRLENKIAGAKLSPSKSGKVLLDGDSIQAYLDSLFVQNQTKMD